MIIKKLPKTRISAQRVFNHVKKHLLTQRAKCTSPMGECKYRKQESPKSPTLACAVGCLIPGHRYRKNMEGWDVDGLIEKGFLPKVLLPHQQLLADLQRVHDCQEVLEWPAGLERVAKDNGLKP